MPRVGNDRIRPTGAAQAQVDATPRALRVINYNAAGGVGGPVTILDGAGGGTLARVDAISSAVRGSLYDAVIGSPLFTSVALGLSAQHALVDIPVFMVQSTLLAAAPDGVLRDATVDLLQKQIVQPYTFPENLTRGSLTAPIGVTTIIAAPPAGQRLHITALSASNSSAAIAAVAVFGDGVTVIEQFALNFPFATHTQSYPCPLRLSAAAVLQVAVLGAPVLVSASGYIGR